MKYIKTYKIFEEYAPKMWEPIPPKWVRLYTNTVLNPVMGLYYPMDSQGDYYNPMNEGEIDIHYIDNDRYAEEYEMSPGDVAIVRQYVKSTEDVYNERVDHELVDTIKDLTLDVMDKYPVKFGGKLFVISSSGEVAPIKSLSSIPTHNTDSYYSLFSHKYEIAETGKICYEFHLSSFTGVAGKLSNQRVGSIRLLDDELKNEFYDDVTDFCFRSISYAISEGYKVKLRCYSGSSEDIEIDNVDESEIRSEIIKNAGEGIRISIR